MSLFSSTTTISIMRWNSSARNSGCEGNKTMDHAFRLWKATGLLLLVAGLYGCNTLHSVPGGTAVSEAVNRSVQSAKELVDSKPKPGGKDDKYCDLFEEPSYEVTNNVVEVVLSTNGLQTIQDWQQGRYTRPATRKDALQKAAENVSR